MNTKERKVAKKTVLTCTALSVAYLVAGNITSNISMASTGNNYSLATDAPKVTILPTITPTYEVVTNMVTGEDAHKIGDYIVTLKPVVTRTPSPTMPSNAYGIGINIVTATPKATVEPTKKPTKTSSPKVIKAETKLYKSIPLSARFQKYIDGLCKDYGISTNVAMAVIARESDFDIDCTGDYGHSKGLMQVWESYHTNTMRKLGATDLYNCWDNVTVGINILATCYKDNGENWHRALMAYNGGQGYCNKRVRNGLYSSDYSVWVMNKAEKYKEERGK